MFSSERKITLKMWGNIAKGWLTSKPALVIWVCLGAILLIKSCS